MGSGSDESSSSSGDSSSSAEASERGSHSEAPETAAPDGGTAPATDGTPRGAAEEDVEAAAEDNELPELPDDVSEDEPKELTKTQIMKGRQARKDATRSVTRSFTTGLMPLSASNDEITNQDPESPRVLSSRESREREDSAGDSPRQSRCCRFPACCPELRARWKRRLERCCWPCLRFATAFGSWWDAFEGRCQGLARSIRCLCCPLLLIFRLLTCGLCRREAPNSVSRATSLRRTFRKSHAQSKSAANLSRSTLAVSRTTSLGASSRSRLTRSSTWGNSRFAEGPPVQPRSRLKEQKRRASQEDKQKIQVAKPQSTREEWRQLRRQATQKAAAEANEQAYEDLDPQDEDVEILTGWEALIWTDFLPWNWSQTYEVWKESRVEMWAALGPILQKMEAADDPDNPYPKCLRRRWRIFFLAYWDPMLDSLPTLGRMVTIVLWSLLLIPISLFIASNIFLLMSVLRNMEYVDGDCVIESLPESFSTERGVVTHVVGTYLIRRFYQASAERLQGSVLQSCDIRVPCDKVDLSRTGRVEDDRCDGFQIWAWNDPIRCFYRRDDEYGESSSSLLCLSRPSDLQEEVFGVIISSCFLLISLVMVALVFLRRILERRETERKQMEFEEAMEKDRAEADAIAQQQFEEFKKQETIEEEDEESDAEGLVFATEATTSLHSRVTRVNGRMTMRGSVSEPVSAV